MSILLYLYFIEILIEILIVKNLQVNNLHGIITSQLMTSRPLHPLSRELLINEGTLSQKSGSSMPSGLGTLMMAWDDDHRQTLPLGAYKKRDRREGDVWIVPITPPSHSPKRSLGAVARDWVD